jgi:hypothetical protein
MTADSDVVGAETVEAVAAAVLRCPAVARLHGGRFNAITSCLPGRRLVGVSVTPTGVTVGVVGRYPGTVAQIAAQVREAVAAAAPGAAVTVAVEDIDIDDVEPTDGDPQEIATRAGPGRRRRDGPRRRGMR